MKEILPTWQEFKSWTHWAWLWCSVIWSVIQMCETVYKVKWVEKEGEVWGEGVERNSMKTNTVHFWEDKN